MYQFFLGLHASLRVCVCVNDHFVVLCVNFCDSLPFAEINAPYRIVVAFDTRDFLKLPFRAG